MTRPLRLAGCSVLIAVALTGCGSTVRTGAAAVVGDSRISTDELARTVSTSLADPAAGQLAGDREGFQRQVLDRLISRRLIDRAAGKAGVTVTPAQVDEQYAGIERDVGGAQALPAQAAAEGLTLPDVRALARTRAQTSGLADGLTKDVQVPPAALQQAYTAGIDRYDQVRTAQIQQPTLAAAQALLPRATPLDDAGFAELARTTSTDETTKATGGDLGLVGRGTFEQGSLGDYGAAAFAAKVGDTFAVASPRGGHVVRVLERRTTTLEQATPELRRSVLANERNEALKKALQQTAKDEHVTVNPRFGRWDDTALQVGQRAARPGQVLSSPATEPPGGPGQPVEPPADPGAPTDPGAPADPGAPTAPGTPPDQGAPTDPGAPVEPSAPVPTPAP